METSRQLLVIVTSLLIGFVLTSRANVVTSYHTDNDDQDHQEVISQHGGAESSSLDKRLSEISAKQLLDELMDVIDRAQATPRNDAAGWTVTAPGVHDEEEVDDDEDQQKEEWKSPEEKRAPESELLKILGSIRRKNQQQHLNSNVLRAFLTQYMVRSG